MPLDPNWFRSPGPYRQSDFHECETSVLVRQSPNSLAAKKPWLAEHCSRATWFRRRKRARENARHGRLDLATLRPTEEFMAELIARTKVYWEELLGESPRR